MSELLPQGVREIAAGQVERLADVVAALSDADLVAPTLCGGWLAAHLLAHVRLGLAEHAVSFAEPAGPADVIDRDYVSYWRDWPPGNRPATYDGVRFHWANASAYATADSLRQHFADTARQAAGISRQAPAEVFRFQGHVMAAQDILAMWTVEWVIHHLDLTAYLPGGRWNRRMRPSPSRSEPLTSSLEVPSGRRPGISPPMSSKAPAGCHSTTPSANSSASAQDSSRPSGDRRPLAAHGAREHRPPPPKPTRQPKPSNITT